MHVILLEFYSPEYIKLKSIDLQWKLYYIDIYIFFFFTEQVNDISLSSSIIVAGCS